LQKRIRDYWGKIQQSFLFDDDQSAPKTNKHLEVIVVLDFLDLPTFFGSHGSFRGRPEIDRAALACAFVAKAILNLATTEALIDRLKVDKVLRRICLFPSNRKLPCKATFSNAFRKFSETDLPTHIHKTIVEHNFSDRLVGHVSRDSTYLEAKETINTKPKTAWRRLKGKRRRLVRQLDMPLNEMLSELPTKADCGRKNGFSWDGYKIHLDVADGDIPLSALLTSASVHDSQVAIPLEAMTLQRVKSLYSLMDSAYDAKEIREFIQQNGKVCIINPQKRNPQPNALDPAQRIRLQERNSVERVNNLLKNVFGGRFINVRGSKKVSAHLMFCLCAITAMQIIRNF